jgi:putative transposase
MHYKYRKRSTPSKGVRISLSGPSWVFLTVCTEKREPGLPQKSVQDRLHQIWLKQATAWLVSDYLLMSDHLHLFCAPYDLAFTIERWISYWKNCFSRSEVKIGKFQRSGFHHRLRSDESYQDKWQYMRENPVRAGLVSNVEDWPYQGRIHEIRWQT